MKFTVKKLCQSFLICGAIGSSFTAWAGNFSASCSAFFLSNSWLGANCKNGSGGENWTGVDLDESLVNGFGKFYWQLNGNSFASARDCNVDSNGILSCQLSDGSGGWPRIPINLNENIGNYFGHMTSDLSSVFPTNQVGTADNAISANNLANPLVYQGHGGDQQQTLQAAIDEAAATRRPLFIPAGTYNHSGILTLNSVQVIGSGRGTVLIATNSAASALRLTGNAPRLSTLTTQASASERSNQPEAANVLIQQANGALVSNLVIKGAGSNGVRADGSYRGKISRNVVIGTNADGIALMNGSAQNVVLGNEVYEAGDDSFSDDSYQWEPVQDHDNTFVRNYAHSNAYGRGIVLMGPLNDVVQDNIVVCEPWVAIGAGQDGGSRTDQGANLHINHNTFYQISNAEPILSNAANSQISDNTSVGSPPDIAGLLGWQPYNQLVSRWTISPDYIPGSGPGSCNGSSGCTFNPPACFPDKR